MTESEVIQANRTGAKVRHREGVVAGISAGVVASRWHGTVEGDHPHGEPVKMGPPFVVDVIGEVRVDGKSGDGKEGCFFAKPEELVLA